jgi:hypothetical protein
LTPEDFERHPVRGFDLSREPGDEGDETWVRPWSFEDTVQRTRS